MRGEQRPAFQLGKEPASPACRACYGKKAARRSFLGGTGDDESFGGEGDDEISAGANNDLIQGGPGADQIDGDSGVDTASYYASWMGVIVSLTSAGWVVTRAAIS